MERLLQDIRYAARSLRKSPLFTTIAVVCLTLGIATNTTLFSCFNGILLRPFPFTEPDRIVLLQERNPRTGGEANLGYLNYLDWKAQAVSFADMAGTSGRSLVITDGDEPERLNGQLVTANLFPMLGVRPQLGRPIRADEDRAGAPGVVLLSDEVWHRQYAADSAIIGRVIHVNERPFTVVGVMPPGFQFPYNGEIWIPMAPEMGTDQRDWRGVTVYARLKPGITVEQADREVQALAKRINARYGLRRDEWQGMAMPLAKNLVADDVRLITISMMGAVTFLLLIACANVANLMLTRAAGRQREIAVRSALGAGRGRIVRQLLTEALLVGLAAGLLAVPLTWVGLRLVDMGIPPQDPLPFYMHWSVDLPTVAYTAGISLLTGVIFGLAPAVVASRGRLTDALKEGGRGTGAGTNRSRLRAALVVTEVALSLILLVGASLFVRSFLVLQRADIGFDVTHTLTMRFYLPGDRYDSAAFRQATLQALVRRVEALPSVESAAISNLIPLDGGGAGGRMIAEGSTVRDEEAPTLFWSGAAGHWFETLGIHMLEGRTFSAQELDDSIPVAVLSRTAARRLWPDESAVGHRFRFAGFVPTTWFTVIGVAPDVRNFQLDYRGQIPPTAYLPYRFEPARNHGLMVRVRGGDPAAVTPAVRSVIRSVDPSIPVFNVATLDEVRRLSFWEYRLFGAMFGVFGGIALFLAAIGVYGVISYGVSQRTQEIGVRVALGAQRRHVIALIVRQGLVLAGIGIAVGIAGAFGVTRVVTSLLFVSATDPLSFVGVSLFLAGVAAVASYVPARRATTVNPIQALRFE